MVAVREAFQIFVHRTLAYHYSHHIGLITFSGTPELAQNINDVVYDFALQVDHIQPGGSTALWKSLELAKDKLAEYSVKYPRAKKRILVLSDGEDNVSDPFFSRMRNIASPFAQGICEEIQVTPDC
jgi:Mg-chelatase subunit ChlD